jgi:hypothetical protein
MNVRLDGHKAGGLNTDVGMMESACHMAEVAGWKFFHRHK